MPFAAFVFLLLRLDQTLDRGLNRRGTSLESPALDELIQSRQRLWRKARREVLLRVASGGHQQGPPSPLPIILAARVLCPGNLPGLPGLTRILIPFLGIGFDPKGSEAPAVEITVGAPSGKEDSNLTHVINNPDHIWVEEDPDGLGVALEVTSPDTGATRVLFEPEPALPGR